MAIIGGNARDNYLAGGPRPDRIFGFGGNDTLVGGFGADTLIGGTGDDLLEGGNGRDALNGGAGDDIASYAANTTMVQADLVSGIVSFPDQRWAWERLTSIEGLIGGSAGDALYGNSVRNTIHGGAGDDEIDGRVGADMLFGDAGDDRLYGGNGSDTIDGGAGSDELYGDGFDADAGPNYFTDVPNALIIGLRKPDTVSYARESAALTLSLAYGEGAATLRGSRDVDTLYGFDNVVGGSGADSITGNGGDNLLVGGRGNDTLVGGAGSDTLAGGNGTDALDGGAGSDTVDYSENTSAVDLRLPTEVVTFPGKAWSPETLISIENAITGSGDDRLIGNWRGNVLDGGLGADRIAGRGGSDTVSYRSHADAVSVDLARGIGTIIDTAVRDRLVSIENATGGAGNDFLRAADTGSVLDGGEGNDTVAGGAGADTIHLSAGSDVIDGGAGSDTVVLDFGYDAYPDLIYNQGYDDAYGDILVEYDGVTDMDLLADLAGGTILTYGGPDVRGTLTGVENVTTGAGNDFVVGSDGANVISVGHGANVVNAGRGNDVIYGSNPQADWGGWSNAASTPIFVDERDASEVLRGGVGADTIVGGVNMFGQGGDDRLVAAKVDVETRMSGGAGADSFVFSDDVDVRWWYEAHVRAEHAVITDFSRDDGDRIIIEHADPATEDPTFVGTVTDVSEIDVGEWGFYDGKLFLPRDYETFEGTETPAGLEIEIVGGDITESDVFFV